MPKSSATVASEPSDFWAELGAAHAAELHTFGFETFKRHQALRYFTWQWRWSKLHQSRQARFLLRHSPPSTVLRCLTARSELSASAWEGVPWNAADRWLYSFATRVLWEYARSRDRAEVLALAEPTLGGPFPVEWRGQLISQDLANSSLETAAILRALAGRTPESILEIGGGYGRTAYVLLSLFPEARYTIVDLEPALSISRRYLTALFPERPVSFLSPRAFFELTEATASLAISISSLQEMTPAQVSAYLARLDRTTAGGTVYLKQRENWFNPVDRVAMRLSDYPIPPGWTNLFFERADVQTDFQQAAWRVP